MINKIDCLCCRNFELKKKERALQDANACCRNWTSLVDGFSAFLSLNYFTKLEKFLSKNHFGFMPEDVGRKSAHLAEF